MRTLSILIILLVISVTTFCEEASLPDTSSNIWLSVVNVNNNDSLNLRQQPTGESMLVYRIPYNAKNLIKISEQENWFKVQYRGYLGWVYSRYVEEARHINYADQFGGELFCLGTEPHWNLKTEGENGHFNFLGNKVVLFQNDSVRESLNQNTLLMMNFSNLQEPQQRLDVTIEKTFCDDGMSDTVYNYKIHAVDTLRTQFLSGCCQLR